MPTTPLIIGTLDDRRRVTQVIADVDELLGHPPAALVGSSIIDMTHPPDAAELRSAFTRAASNVNALVRVRMRHRHRPWQRATVIVSVLHG